MIIDVRIKNNWFHKNNIFVKGHLFFNDKVYKEAELCDLFVGIEAITDLISLLREATGYFSIILSCNDGTFLVSDRIRSYPMFYKRESATQYIISDSPYIMDKNTEFNSLSIIELEAAGYVTGKDTLFRTINQSKSGQILFFGNDGDIKEFQYFDFPVELNKFNDHMKLLVLLKDAYDQAINRLLKYLDGRQAVIPLSGGLDSRLVLALLKANNYDNILTYTYGREEKHEVLVSRELAHFHNVKWICVPYQSQSMNKLFESKDYLSMATKCGQGISVPVIQDWYAIDYLINAGYLSDKCVVIPGHTVVSIVELLPEKIRLNKDISDSEITQEIIKSNFVYNSDCFRDETYKILENKIRNEYKIKSKIYSAEEAYSFVCNYSYHERQTKYTVNSIRMYENYQLDWYLPFWDLEVLKAWSQIPKELTTNRKIYYEFIETYFPEMQAEINVFGHNREIGVAIKENFIKQFGKKYLPRLFKIYSAINRRKQYYLNLDGYVSSYDFYASIFKKRYSYIEMWCQRYLKFENELRKQLNTKGPNEVGVKI